MVLIEGRVRVRYLRFREEVPILKTICKIPNTRKIILKIVLLMRDSFYNNPRLLTTV